MPPPIELLRIISMLFIVFSHYTVHNGIANPSLSIGFNRFFLEVTILGNIGVILFVLISGYFLIDSDKFKLKKLLKIILQVWVYSSLIYIIFCISGLTDFSIKGLIKNIFPITFKQYWFATAYVVLYIFHPFINKFLKSLSKREYQLFLIISLTMFSIIVSCIGMGSDFYGNELIQFIMFYSIGGYLKKHKLFSKKRNSIILISSICILILSVISVDLLSVKFPSLGKYANHFYDRNSIVAIAFSVSLFNYFINKKSFNNKFINLISSATFGVYLIHDNNYIRSFLWNDIFHNKDYVSSNMILLHVLISVGLVFIVCVLIDLIRQKLIEKPLFKILDKKIDNAQAKIDEKIYKA